MRWRLIVALQVAAALTGSVAAQDAPSPATLSAQRRVLATAPFGDDRDVEFASRGFVATRSDPLIKAADGRTVWDLSAFDFLQRPEAPPTVNPSLWRESRLLAGHGLFGVTERIWQVRGFDLANITFVAGERGWIVIDALGSVETARAALDLVSERLGPRPISALVYTHSHIDHFGGAGGLVSAEDVASGRVPVLAPKGFLAAAVGENLLAGPAMQRRALYQFGVLLPKGPQGLVGSGIGPGLASGTPSLLPPTREIDRTGETVEIDGVRMRFQFTPGTEAPAEMNIQFPDWRVVDMAENANVTQHNILTPRGAVVRDAKAWADALSEALELFGDSDVLVTSHGWPRFGRAEVTGYLAKHRDAYAFLHDQTVRLMNRGLTGDEIAARLDLPDVLAREWYNRPYYGSLSFNSRAVYQFYMGWYDANPVHLAALPPAEAGRRYVAAMGGAAKVRAMAEAAYAAGDYAWAAELLNRAVMADERDAEARSLLARCYDQLAWQSENSLWRNIYLTGAAELRGAHAPPSASGQAALAAHVPTAMLFDVLATRLDAEKAGAERVRLAFVFPDRGEETYVTVENGVLTHRATPPPEPVDATLTVKRADFLAAVLGGAPIAQRIARGEATISGDASAFSRLLGWLEAPRRDFPIVTR